MVLLQTFLAVALAMLPCVAVVEGGPYRDSHNSTHSPVDFDDSWDFECTSSDQCQNGGTCVFEVYGIVLCECPETHTGWNCEIRNECHSDPCEHSGICDIDYLYGGYYCACQEGWTGEDCETASDTTSCADVTCENGGTCFHYEHSTFCICPYGLYYGWHCEFLDDYTCDEWLAPCANGGTCVAIGRDHHCECTDEWSGKNCTEPFPVASLCDGFCENGGSCFIDERRHAPTCHCAPGWYGEHCSKPTGLTTQSPCQGFCENGGSCYIYNHGPVCYCRREWQGQFCTEPVMPSETPETGASGLPVGGIVGAAVGSLVLFFVIFGAMFVLNLARASKNRRSRPPPPPAAAAAASPSVIYHPGVHDDFDGPIRSLAYKPPSQRPAKDLYSSDPHYQSKLARRYTPAPVRGHAHQDMNYPGSRHHSAEVWNPAAGAYDYAYEPGPPKARVAAPRAPANQYEYAYAITDAAPPRASSRASSSPMPYGPPPVYSRAPSRAPSVAASRVSEHTYQSLSEYGETASSSKGANMGPAPP